jgi:hypothetical protein
MVPADLKDFTIAALGASASFIGLLFVALSVVLDKASNQKLADHDRQLAESSYAGLINIFFVTLSASIPNESIGVVCLVMATIGLVSCWRLRHISQLLPIAVSAAIYLVEIWFSVKIFHHHDRPFDISIFQFIIIALFSISLFRAWSLTGIHAATKKGKV